MDTVLDLIEFRFNEREDVFFGYKIMEKKLCFYPYGMKEFFIYDIETKSIQTKKVSIDANQIPVYNDLLNQKWSAYGTNTILESEYISMCDMNYQLEMGTTVLGPQNYGRNIYQSMRE